MRAQRAGTIEIFYLAPYAARRGGYKGGSSSRMILSIGIRDLANYITLQHPKCYFSVPSGDGFPILADTVL